ncbi:MAG: HAD family hydrolase [Candidatus Nanoarchaeia archaeon]|jgi:phosphoglycolate phosphatase|nr:HAD family hydrolase [Candidatus Nanoarchaeia archaeon]|tara:strand:- start:271 stop:909 length:639 start_codon:yes stop_codon:yes gene_type:complete
MVKPQKKEIIVFDFDGTLVDSAKEIVDAYNESFTRNNLYKVPARTIKRHLGKFRETIIHKIYPSLGKRKIQKIAEDQSKLLDITKATAKPNIVKTLAALNKKYTLAIASNAEHKTIVETLQNLEINPRFFKAIVGMDNVKHRKPSTEPLKKLEKALGSKIKAVVGDTETDIQMAKNYNVMAIAVVGTRTYKDLLKEYPDIIVTDLSELTELI